jgi:hypothetical protein
MILPFNRHPRQLIPDYCPRCDVPAWHTRGKAPLQLPKRVCGSEHKAQHSGADLGKRGAL